VDHTEPTLEADEQRCKIIVNVTVRLKLGNRACLEKEIAGRFSKITEPK
jgi:hypothetical protein